MDDLHGFAQMLDVLRERLSISSDISSPPLESSILTCLSSHYEPSLPHHADVDSNQKLAKPTRIDYDNTSVSCQDLQATRSSIG